MFEIAKMFPDKTAGFGACELAAFEEGYETKAAGDQAMDLLHGAAEAAMADLLTELCNEFMGVGKDGRFHGHRLAARVNRLLGI